MLKKAVPSSSDLTSHIQSTLVQGVHGIDAISLAGLFKSYMVRAYRDLSVQANIPNATWTQVQLQAESYDPNSNFDTSSYKYTVPRTGKYLIQGQVIFTSVVADKTYYAAIKVGGVELVRGQLHSSNTDDLAVLASPGDIYLIAAGGEIMLYCYHNAGVGTVGVQYGPSKTFLTIAFFSD